MVGIWGQQWGEPFADRNTADVACLLSVTDRKTLRRDEDDLTSDPTRPFPEVPYQPNILSLLLRTWYVLWECRPKDAPSPLHPWSATSPAAGGSSGPSMGPQTTALSPNFWLLSMAAPAPAPAPTSSSDFQLWSPTTIPVSRNSASHLGSARLARPDQS